MPAGAVPSLDLSVKVSDLTSASQLQKLLKSDAMPAFQFAAELAPLWNGTIDKVPVGTKASFNLSQDSKWKTKTGIGFGLTEKASCELEIVKSGCVLQYVDQVDSTSKSNLPADAYPNCTYLKLTIDFTIDGNVSGTGKVGALGIDGNAKGSEDASFVFAHKVTNTTVLGAAVKEAFEKLVFPFEPSCAADMAAGDITSVSFNGTLSCTFDLTYGLGKYKFSAPSVATALLRKAKDGVDLGLPQGSIDLGASVSVGYTHSDDFTTIVQKTDSSNAFLYVMRAHKDDGSVGASLKATVDISKQGDVKVDQKAVADAVNKCTRGMGGSAAASLADELAQKLTDKCNSWISNEIKNGAELQAKWDAQSSTTMLFKYKVVLGNTDLSDKTWGCICQGNIVSAVMGGGLVLDAGSGVDKEMSRSFTVGITFFNFFHAQDVNTYFQKSKVVVTDKGNLRFLFDVGDESDGDLNGILQKTRIHFVADATANQAADVQLQVELSETKSQKEAQHIAGVAGYLAGPQAAAAKNDMAQFISKQPAGTVNLTCVLEPSDYSKLNCTPYDGNKPPQNQSVDGYNWQVFHNAAMALLENMDFAKGVTFQDWQAWNEMGNGSKPANRRRTPDWSAALNYWEGRSQEDRENLNYFCTASTDFMNMCDDLHRLADRVAQAKIPDDWNQLLAELKSIVQKDVNVDYVKAAVASLLNLSQPGAVDYEKNTGKNSITCTLTLK